MNSKNWQSKSTKLNSNWTGKAYTGGEVSQVCSTMTKKVYESFAFCFLTLNIHYLEYVTWSIISFTSVCLSYKLVKWLTFSVFSCTEGIPHKKKLFYHWKGLKSVIKFVNNNTYILFEISIFATSSYSILNSCIKDAKSTSVNLKL